MVSFASGPQPHPSFIEVSCEAPLGDDHWALEGAREDAEEMRVARLTASQGDHPDQGVLPQDEPTAGILNAAAFMRI